MVYTDPLLSDDAATVAAGLWSAIDLDREGAHKIAAQTGIRYYEAEHDILANRVFYVNDAGHLVEDKYAANVRIPHPFLTELIDQKVQYLLAQPVEFTVENDPEFEKRLGEYYGDDFQLFLQDLVAGASQKGFEYAFARTTADDKLCFQIADSLTAFPVYDENRNPVRIVRYYEVRGVTDAARNRVRVTRAEVWDDKQVWFFVAERHGTFRLDPSVAINPRPHVLAVAGETDDLGGEEVRQYLGRSYGTLPFFRFQNNVRELTDLHPVKAIIDDYDLMNAYLSNNLQDFTDALYVVKGYVGDDLDKLRMNLKAKKSVAVGEGGDVDIRTVQIPVEGRQAKLDIDRENIYRFGMGFDSAQIGDGNITNVVIKSRYALLSMKANKTEARLRVALKWINRLVVADINRRFGTSYDPNLVEFCFNREALVSATDDAQVEFNEAQAQATRVNTIIAAATRIDDESVLKLLCEEFDLDWEDVQKALDDEGTPEPLDPTPTPVDPTQPVPGAGAVPQAPAGLPAPAALAVGA